MPFDLEAIRARAPSHTLHYFESIGSTMVEATRLANDNHPHGTVVVAGQQTAGIGRLGRTWISEPGLGLYCSILLRLNLPPANLPVASLLLGIAVVEAIENSTGLACDLRWPNDVLIREKKVCGILTHLAGACVIAGVGLNVNHHKFEAGLRTPATSLFIESGRLYSLEELLVALLSSLDTCCRTLETKGRQAILNAFSRHSSYVAGRRVSVEESGLRGTTAGLDAFGFLQLRTDAGQLHRLSAGGIRPLSHDG